MSNLSAPPLPSTSSTSEAMTLASNGDLPAVSAGRMRDRIGAAYRSGGVGEVLKRAVFQVIKHDPQHLYLLHAERGPESLPVEITRLLQRVRRRLQVEWLSEGSMQSLPAYLAYRSDISSAQVGAWLRAGHATVLIRYDRQIVADGWLALRSFPLPEGRVSEQLTQPDCAFTFLSYVSDAHRGLGVLPVIIEEQLRLMHREGKTKLLGTVTPTNVLSIRSVEKLGFRRIGTLHVWWLLGRKWARVSLRGAL